MSSREPPAYVWVCLAVLCGALVVGVLTALLVPIDVVAPPATQPPTASARTDSITVGYDILVLLLGTHGFSSVAGDVDTEAYIRGSSDRIYQLTSTGTIMPCADPPHESPDDRYSFGPTLAKMYVSHGFLAHERAVLLVYGDMRGNNVNNVVLGSGADVLEHVTDVVQNLTTAPGIVGDTVDHRIAGVFYLGGENDPDITEVGFGNAVATFMTAYRAVTADAPLVAIEMPIGSSTPAITRALQRLPRYLDYAAAALAVSDTYTSTDQLLMVGAILDAYRHARVKLPGTIFDLQGTYEDEQIRLTWSMPVGQVDAYSVTATVTTTEATTEEQAAAVAAESAPFYDTVLNATSMAPFAYNDANAPFSGVYSHLLRIGDVPAGAATVTCTVTPTVMYGPGAPVRVAPATIVVSITVPVPL